MKTVLVPVDFSETSLNAAAYAVKMFTGVYGINITLYHVYERPEHRPASVQELNKLKAQLSDIGIVKMQTFCEEGYDFEKCVERLTRENKTELIVIGITGRNKVGQTLVGSNTLKITQKKICPVLIVPPNAKFNQLKNFALTSEFITVPSPHAAAFIKNLLSSFFARLHIVNVNTEPHAPATEKRQQIKAEMHQLFKGFERDFHFISHHNFQEAMNLFVKDFSIDMIITMPKDHNWLSTLTGGTATQKIAYQSTVPVLAIHQ